MILSASYNSLGISEENLTLPDEMADEFDVDDLLEAPYKKPDDSEVSCQFWLVLVFSVLLVEWHPVK